MVQLSCRLRETRYQQDQGGEKICHLITTCRHSAVLVSTYFAILFKVGEYAQLFGKLDVGAQSDNLPA